MLNWMIDHQLDSLERRLGSSVDYRRYLARSSKSAFFKFMGFVPMAAHHGNTPRRILSAARVFPTLKRGLGYAVSCKRAELRVPQIAGADVS